MRFLIAALLAFLLPLAAVPAWATDITPSPRVKRAVIIRAAPDTHSIVLGRLAPGESLVLEEVLPGWYKVRLADGRTGFVSKTWTIVAPEVGLMAQPNVAVGETKVHVIDVGTGLAVFIEGPGFTMLYDAGSQDDLAGGAPTVSSHTSTQSGRTSRRSTISSSAIRTRTTSSSCPTYSRPSW